MDKLLRKLTYIKSVLKTKKDADQLADLAKEVKELKSMLKEVLLAQEIASLKTLLADLKMVSESGIESKPHSLPESTTGEASQEPYNQHNLPMQDRDKALEQLEGMAGTKMIDGVKNFILHRATDNFEYENAFIDGKYKTGDNSDWIADQELADAAQNGNNPVVSCFIPESNIKQIVGQSGEVGTMGDALPNPTSLEYRIVVSPGTYVIYREKKSMSGK